MSTCIKYNSTDQSRIPELFGIEFEDMVLWFLELGKKDLLFHLDDIPYELLVSGGTDEKCFSPFEAGQVTAIVAVLDTTHGRGLVWDAFSIGDKLADRDKTQAFVNWGTFVKDVCSWGSCNEADFLGMQLNDQIQLIDLFLDPDFDNWASVVRAVCSWGNFSENAFSEMALTTQLEMINSFLSNEAPSVNAA